MNKQVGALPSTNTVPAGPRTLPRRETSDEGFAWAAAALRSSPVRAWLSEKANALIDQGRLDELFVHTGPMYALRGATLLATWWERYRQSFSDPEFPQTPPV